MWKMRGANLGTLGGVGRSQGPKACATGWGLALGPGAAVAEARVRPSLAMMGT